MKKGDLSKFIEEAGRWRVFHSHRTGHQGAQANTDPEELQALIDEAVQEVRANRRAKEKADKA
jgi:hypothetical protein